MNYDAINHAAMQHATTLIPQFFPNGKQQGNEYVAINPNRHDTSLGSFSINMQTGHWADFATNDRGGDIISLLAFRDGCQQSEAAKKLATILGISADDTKTTAIKLKDDWQPITPAPDILPLERHHKHGSPTMRWRYVDAQGNTLCWIYRFDIAEGKKQFAPVTYGVLKGKKDWHFKALPAPRPLYNLHGIATYPDAIVIVCEGEKSADAAAKLFPAPQYVTTTAMNGAQSMHNAEWSPLAGRKVWLWPDNADDGFEAMKQAAKYLADAGAASIDELQLEWFNQLPDGNQRQLPPKWDAADAIEEGYQASDIGKFIADASNFIVRDVPAVTAVHSSNSNGFSGTSPDTANDADVTATDIPSEKDRPCYRIFDDWVKTKDRKYRPGVWYFSMSSSKKSNETPVPVSQWICSPLHVEAITYDAQENNFGRYLRFKNTMKRWRTWAMPMSMLKGTGEELRGELMSMGVEIDPHARTMLSSYLQAQHPDKKMHCALQVGWCDGSFVLPDRVLGNKSDNIIFQSGEHVDNEYTCSGTLEGWKDTIAAKAINNPMLVTTLSTTFAGALMQKCNAESGGLHLVGDSSTGKTGLIEAACSVWGGDNFKRSWRATANGMEGVAAMFNDGLLALDEISECDPREVGAIVYSLGNGRGKQRASRSGAARSVKRWRCFVISSGERSIETTMAEGGHRIKAGQNTRLPSVLVARKFGVWDDLHGLTTGAALTDAIKSAAKEHYGRAGRTYLEKLAYDTRDFSAYLERIKALPEFTIEASQGQAKRVAARFALIAMAGELATEYGITGWSEGTAIKCVSSVLHSWAKTLGTHGNHEHNQILEGVSDFIERHGDSRFSTEHSPDSLQIRDRAGWWREEDGERIYYFNAAGMKEALKGFDFKRALDELQQAGALPPAGTNGERAKAMRFQGRQVKVYAINPNRLGEHHES